MTVLENFTLLAQITFFLAQFANDELTLLEKITPWAQLAFYLTPLIIAVATFALAWWRFNLFRTREPAITTDLQVTSRRSSPSYNALSAVVVMTNTSRVAVRITTLKWEIRVLAPYTDAAVASKIDEYKPQMEMDGAPVEFPWNINYTIS